MARGRIGKRPDIQRPQGKPKAETGAGEQGAALTGSLTQVPPVQRKCASCEGADEMPVQPKLQVGPSDDAFEREADRLADQVTGGRDVVKGGVSQVPGPSVQQSAEDGAASGGADQAAAAVRSSGRAMSTSERAYFEPRFGQDFSDVRIHEGPEAASAADGIGARAYTLGNDIAFNEGSYSEGSSEGRWLMAHELSHTIQQGQGAGPQPKLIQRVDFPDWDDLEEGWDRTKRFGKRQWDRGGRAVDKAGEYLERGADKAGEYWDRGADKAEYYWDKGIEKGGKAVDKAGEALGGVDDWWSRGDGDIERMDFNGTTLKLSGAVSKTYDAVSGLMPSKKTGGVDYTQPEYQEEPDKGPIPEGEYYLDPSEVESNPPGTFPTSAWGKYRTRLHETVTTGLYRRAAMDRTGGFYLHEDANNNGTAGCIGLENAKDNKEIQGLVKGNSAQIPVHVDYSSISAVIERAAEEAGAIQRSPLQSSLRALGTADGMAGRQVADGVIQRDDKAEDEQHYLIAAGIAKINKDLEKYSEGAFPSDYYDTLARHLFKKALRANGRDYGDAFDELNDLQWGEFGSGLSKHYTKIVGTDSANGWDKFRHYVYTAYLQYSYSGVVAPEAFTYGKEAWDQVEYWFGYDPEGYSVPDIRADNKGEAFGEEMETQEDEEFLDMLENTFWEGMNAFTDPRSWGL